MVRGPEKWERGGGSKNECEVQGVPQIEAFSGSGRVVRLEEEKKVMMISIFGRGSLKEQSERGRAGRCAVWLEEEEGSGEKEWASPGEK